MKTFFILMLFCLSACGKQGTGVFLKLEPLKAMMVSTAVTKLQLETGLKQLEYSDGSNPMITIEYATNQELAEFGIAVLGVAKVGDSPCEIRIAHRTFTYTQDWINSVVWHEIGHCFNLMHTTNPEDIMYRYAAPLSDYSNAILQDFFRRLHEAAH